MKCYHDVGTYIGMKIRGFCVVEMVYGVIALQEGYGIITDHIQRIYWWRSAYVMLQTLSFDILFMWDRGPLGESP